MGMVSISNDSSGSDIIHTNLVNFEYCTIIVCTMPKKASYEGKTPVRPVNV